MLMLLRGFATFSKTSGLVSSVNKSEIFESNIDQHDMTRITSASGFVLVRLPFRYLGVPISSTEDRGL